MGDPNGSSSTSGSRHPTGSLRVSMQSSPHKDVGGHAYELTPHQDGSQQSSSGSEPPSRRSRKQQHHHHHSSSEPARTVGGGGDLPLPEGLVERMQASSWSERFEAITELEKYVATAAPQNMTTQLQKVRRKDDCAIPASTGVCIILATLKNTESTGSGYIHTVLKLTYIY